MWQKLCILQNKNVTPKLPQQLPSQLRPEDIIQTSVAPMTLSKETNEVIRIVNQYQLNITKLPKMN